MSNLQFNIQIQIINAGVLPEIQARMADLSPAFEAIFHEWVDVNKQKFELSEGMESSGANEFGEFWKGLTSPYMKQKRSDGFPDWLMVRTGALRDAMTNPDALFQKFEAQEAIYGAPNDPDLVDRIRWNPSRPVVFLGLPDMNSIRRILGDYFGLGGNFSKIRNEKALRMMNLKDEIEVMDADFQLAVS